MRRPSLAILATLVVFILIASACSSTQPDTGGKQTASLNVVARANVRLVDCFEVWVDTDGVGGPDFNTGTIQCFQTGEPKVTARRVPWRYSIEVSMIKNGETTETLVGSSVVPGDSIDDFVSLTGYDETPPETSGTRPPDGATYYVNGKRVAEGSEMYISSLGLDLGPPNVLEASPTFDFQIGNGDTVIVRARKQPNADGPSPPYLALDEPDTALSIDGVLTIGGVQVDVNGEPVSAETDMAGISFSFTKR